MEPESPLKPLPSNFTHGHTDEDDKPRSSSQEKDSMDFTLERLSPKVEELMRRNYDKLMWYKNASFEDCLEAEPPLKHLSSNSSKRHTDEGRHSQLRSSSEENSFEFFGDYEAVKKALMNRKVEPFRPSVGEYARNLGVHRSKVNNLSGDDSSQSTLPSIPLSSSPATKIQKRLSIQINSKSMLIWKLTEL